MSPLRPPRRLLPLLALLLAATWLAPAGAPPASKELFAKEDWYLQAPGKEQLFVGKLQRLAAPQMGFGRFNPYRLTLLGPAKSVREVYIGGSPEILAEYVGQLVMITGKPVDMEVEGEQHAEIWPARIALAPPPTDQGGVPQPKK